jgi:MtaA/CmuA family methyltransferase
MNSRERVLAKFKGRQVDRLPVMPFAMQLASDLIGNRYYDYATDYRVLADAQVNIAQKLGFDFVTCVSDPAREAGDCGARVIFSDNSPPAIDNHNPLLADKARLLTLKMPDPLGNGRMRDRVNAVALLKQRIGNEKVIEGWVEGPMAEAADLRGLEAVMMDFFDESDFLNDLFHFVIEMELRFARAQVEAGVDIVGIGDAAASLIGPQLYNEFIWLRERELIDGIHNMGAAVRLHICGNTKDIFEDMGRLGCELIDVDYLTPMLHARQKAPHQLMMTNLDPVSVLQDGTPETIYEKLEQCVGEAGQNLAIGAGCEIPRTAPVENILVLQRFSKENGAN